MFRTDVRPNGVDTFEPEVRTRKLMACFLCMVFCASTAVAEPPANAPSSSGVGEEGSPEGATGGEGNDRTVSPPRSAKPSEGKYDEITVTASPLPRSLSELATPADVLSGEELHQRQESTLGETLSSEPGVSSTYFGPNASRPIIRGQGGDHIRILNNGIGPLDASAASPDHAVSIDPMNVKRVEIVRGPAALLYGPTAVGGAINVIDNRIPDERIPSLLTMALEPRWNSASSEWGGAGLAEGGYGGFAFHLDGLGRDTKNIAIPGFARSERLRATVPLADGEVEAKDRLPNSGSSTQAGSWGASYIWDGGYLGVAPSWYHSEYGTVAEREVSIKLDQPRLDVAGGFNSPVPHLTSLKYKLGLSDYEHTEFEGAEVGTKFKNRGWDGRIDGIHDRIGPFEGAIGVETVGFTFSALGAEAFLPETENRITSGFIFEEMQLSPVRLQFGGRFDYESVDASADENFGPASSESFPTGSGSAGAVYSPVESYPLGLSVSYTSRAPVYQELYANGPHLATGQFEVGDRDLSVEHTLGIDLSLHKTAGRVTGFVTAFYNHVDDFIGLIPTGETEDELPVFAFRNLPADFIGGEAGTTIRLAEWRKQALDLDLSADYVHVRNRDTGDPLPQIPPFRFRSRFIYGWEQLQSVLEIVNARKQDRNAENELPTDGYTLLNLAFEYNLFAGRVRCDTLIRGNNLTDAEVRDSTSVLKDIAPLPGRGVSGGVRLSF
jgi:iron complex outermembrane receptor protein